MSTHQDLMPEPRTRTSKRIPQNPQRRIFSIDDLTSSLYKNFYEHPRRTFIQATMQRILKIPMQGPLEEDFDRISARSSDKDLNKIMSQGIVKKLDQDLHAWTPKRIPLDRHKRTCCWSGSCKILIQELPKGMPEEISYKHLKYMACARSSCKGLLERISPQDFLTRTCTRSC